MSPQPNPQMFLRRSLALTGAACALALAAAPAGHADTGYAITSPRISDVQGNTQHVTPQHQLPAKFSTDASDGYAGKGVTASLHTAQVIPAKALSTPSGPSASSKVSSDNGNDALPIVLSGAALATALAAAGVAMRKTHVTRGVQA